MSHVVDVCPGQTVRTTDETMVVLDVADAMGWLRRSKECGSSRSSRGLAEVTAARMERRPGRSDVTWPEERGWCRRDGAQAARRQGGGRRLRWKRARVETRLGKQLGGAWCSGVQIWE